MLNVNEASEWAGEAPRYADTNLGKGTDWQDVLFYDNAPVMNTQLSFSGASDKVNYYFSMGYYDQDGIIGGNYNASNYKRFSVRSNTLYTLFDDAERDFLKKMSIGMNVSYSRVNSRGVNVGSLTGSPLGDALFLDPNMKVFAESESELQNYESKYGKPITTNVAANFFLCLPATSTN